MNTDEIINQALLELKENEQPFVMFKEFSFMKGLGETEGKFLKIKYLLRKSEPFDEHTEYAIKLSSKGIVISNDFKDWYDYKKSLKPKIEYAKWAAILIAILSLAWNIYQGVSNNSLKEDNRMLNDEIEALEKDNARLVNEIKQVEKTH